MSYNLIALASDISGARVLCVGDVILDRFVNGEVTRISPEAPVPVIHIQKRTAMLGGAGNVIRNVVALGGHGTLIALTGDDAAADEINIALHSLDRSTAALVRDPSRATTIKTRFVAGNQQILRADSEVTIELADGVEEAIMAKVTANISKHNVLVLSDYGKGVLNRGRVQHMIKAAKTHGIPVIIDPKGVDYGIYAGADVITPNRKEIREASNMPVRNVEDAARAALEISARHNIAAVLVTLSQDGMLLATKATTHHLRAEAQEVFDVSGAGDTVVATIASALAVGADLENAARLANICAGIVVAKTGTAAAYLAEVESILNHRDFLHSGKKLLNLDEAKDRVKVWKSQNLKIGFTNGCFDLLHPGHIFLLSQARNACDRLIIAVNSDRSVTRLKGDDRPIQSEAARVAILAALASVDLCISFDEDTPLSLINALKPDVLIKGADYPEDQIIGAAEVRSWGGKVIIAKLKEGFSTTATINDLVNDDHQ